MAMRVFGILVLTGLCHLSSAYEYVFVNQPMTWPDAQAYCRENYIDLATVNDAQDLDKIVGLVDPGVQQVFLGLERVWVWSLSSTVKDKEPTANYTNWANGQPEGQYFCGITSNGEWSTRNCSLQLNFFCYNESAKNISQRFILVPVTMDWYNAQSYCMTQHTGLAITRNLTEDMELMRMMMEDTMVSEAWIGLTGLAWNWSDESKSTYMPWKPLEPELNGVFDCAVLEVHTSTLGMFDDSCMNNWSFICSKVPVPVKKHFVNLKLAADSSVDMKDPAVIASILKGIEEKLRAQGVSQKFTLSWSKSPEKQDVQ